MVWERRTGLVRLLPLYVIISDILLRTRTDHPSPGYNYLTFDVIGDLAFGSPFGMLKAAKDIAPIAKSQIVGMSTYGDENAEVEVEYTGAVRLLHQRGDYVASLGVLPMWIRPFLKKFHPWYRQGSISAANLVKLAVPAVSKRLRTPTDRVDLFSKLSTGKDSEGKPLGAPELTAEALTQLIAGSDTTSKYGSSSPFLAVY